MDKIEKDKKQMSMNSENLSKKNSKKILIVSPDSGEVSSYSQFFAPPLGVLRLAGYLKSKGHDAVYYDSNLYACNKLGKSLEEMFQLKNWDIIGFSILDETLLQDIQNMYLAKKLRPDALIIAGGVEAQFNYQTILDKTPCRIVILGEGETAMLMLANGHPWKEIPGIVAKNVANALSQELFNEATETIPWEKINYEAYWDVYKKMYGDQWNGEIEDMVNTVRVFSRNRCPIGCKYCSSTFQLTLATNKNVPVVSATEENLIHVIKRIKTSHPKVKMIYLTDDDFVINKASVIRFCKLVVKEKNAFGDLKFMCFARITDLNENVLQWMKKANFCKLNIGVESFSQKVLDEVGKRCDVNEIEPVLKLVKKYNIRPFMNIIMTTPGSTMADVEVTLDKVAEIMKDPFYIWGPIIGIQPLKGTTFFEEHVNFKSYITDIKDTNYKIRRDDYIYPKDPLVKELVKRYLARQDSQLKAFIKANDIRHPSNANIAGMQFNLAREIIKEIKAEIANDSFVPTEKVFEGAGRLYKGSPLHKSYVERDKTEKDSVVLQHKLNS